MLRTVFRRPTPAAVCEGGSAVIPRASLHCFAPLSPPDDTGINLDFSYILPLCSLQLTPRDLYPPDLHVCGCKTSRPGDGLRRHLTGILRPALPVGVITVRRDRPGRRPGPGARGAPPQVDQTWTILWSPGSRVG